MSSNSSFDKIVESIALTLKEKIIAGKRASLIVPGGSSPVNIFDSLSKVDINWKMVDLCLVDDRFLDSNHVDSNEKLLKETFIKNKASCVNYFSLKSLVNKNIPIKQPFDICLLGMGDDGHFASIFPNVLENSKFKILKEALICKKTSKILSIPPSGNPYHPRVSMNLGMILNSKRIILLVSSKKKMSVYEDSINDKMIPLYYLRNQLKPIELLKTFV
jgi:6-phosphogluconolactonase